MDCDYAEELGHRMAAEGGMEGTAWLRVRVRILNLRGEKCEKCGAEERLDVHHLTYENFGFEKDEDLQILCQNCHRAVHRRDIWGDRVPF